MLPPELGGLGLDHVAFAIAAEEIGRACASTALVYVMHVGAAQTILLFGNDDQKRRWLQAARDGVIGTYSTSEKASGGHWWFNFSQATRDGDDYLINAEKSFTTSSGQADYYVMQTRSPDAKGPTDITFFIVDGKAPGIKAGDWEALGVHGNHSGPITLRRRRGAAARPPGRRGAGEGHHLSRGLAGVSDRAGRGVARRRARRAGDVTEYATRPSTATSIGGWPTTRCCASSWARPRCWSRACGPGRRRWPASSTRLQAAGKPQGEILLPLTEFKVHAAEVANQVARLALDVSGGYGYKRGPLERSFRDARAAIGMGPSNNIAREWIGKTLVGLPLELFEAGGE